MISSNLAASMIGAGLAITIFGTGIMTPPPPAPLKKRPDCLLSYSMPDNMAVKLLIPCEVYGNAAARAAVIQDKVATRQTMGLALHKPIGGKQIYDRLAQNDQPKSNYSTIIEKKRSEIEAAKKKGKKK